LIKKNLSPIRKLHRYLFIFILVAGFYYILFPCVVHADVFGTEIQDVYEDITENVKEVNDILTKAFELSKQSPYTLLKGYKVPQAETIYNASKQAALVVAVLLLMVDFFRKSVHFDWSSRWENVLIFLVKVIVVKQVVQNADVIVSHIYALCDWVNGKAFSTSGTVELLPYDAKPHEYKVSIFGEVVKQASQPWWTVIKNVITPGTKPLQATYNISFKAVKIFYPNATFPTNLEFAFEDHPFDSPYGANKIFNPTIEKIFLWFYFIFMKLIAYYIIVVVIGRTFELCVYTLLAPLPLATFASEVASDTAKNFIRNYMACALQVTVIATFFTVYTCMMKNLAGLSGLKYIEIIMLASLAVAVSRSGDWSRRLCGAS